MNGAAPAEDVVTSQPAGSDMGDAVQTGDEVTSQLSEVWRTLPRREHGVQAACCTEGRALRVLSAAHPNGKSVLGLG